MHHYQFNIADYRKDTAHLTLLEHAIYRSLIDTYYLNEEPLCGDDAKLMRTHCIRTKEEKQAFESVLSDFFVLQDGAYRNFRCDQELARIYEKSEKARASAEARWKKKNANAMRTHNERNANGMLPITYNPIPKDKKPKASVSLAEKHNGLAHKVVDSYSEIIKNKCHAKGVFKKTFLGNETRSKQLYARISENEEHQSTEFWQAYFNKCAEVRWIREGIDGEPVCTIDMLVNKTKFYKNVEAFWA